MSAEAERAGIAFVISGPSGVGKSTLIRRLLARLPGVEFSISHTTRPPRAGEVDGRDYHFVSVASFRELIEAEAFLEWAEYQGNYYGTSRAAVDEPTSQGIDLILEVEVQGARQLRDRLPAGVPIFILPPPSLEELDRRLRGRGSDDEQAIAKRLERAREEIREAAHYRYVVVNQDMDRAVEDLARVIAASHLETERVLPAWKKRLDAGP